MAGLEWRLGGLVADSISLDMSNQHLEPMISFVLKELGLKVVSKPQGFTPDESFVCAFDMFLANNKCKLKCNDHILSKTTLLFIDIKRNLK